MSTAPIIKVLFFQPGHPPRLLDTVEDNAAYARLLGCDDLDATFFQVDGHMYALWCDDNAYDKKRPLNRRIVSGRYRNWMLRGPFFIARVQGDREVSVDARDYPNIARIVEL